MLLEICACGSGGGCGLDCCFRRVDVPMRVMSEDSTLDTAHWLALEGDAWRPRGATGDRTGDAAAGELGDERTLANARWHTLLAPPVAKNCRPSSAPKSTIHPHPPGASLFRTKMPACMPHTRALHLQSLACQWHWQETQGDTVAQTLALAGDTGRHSSMRQRNGMQSRH